MVNTALRPDIKENSAKAADSCTANEDHCQQGLTPTRTAIATAAPTTAGLVYPHKPFNGLS